MNPKYWNQMNPSMDSLKKHKFLTPFHKNTTNHANGLATLKLWIQNQSTAWFEFYTSQRLKKHPKSKSIPKHRT